MTSSAVPWCSFLISFERSDHGLDQNRELGGTTAYPDGHGLDPVGVQGSVCLLPVVEYTVGDATGDRVGERGDVRFLECHKLDKVGSDRVSKIG